jgi:hypothetical protein
MVFSRNNILTFIFIMIGLSVKAQSFSYSYIDPCTKISKSIVISSLNGNSPIVMNYYGQVKTFTTSELQDGTFDTWANGIYSNYGKGNPCEQVGIVTITTNVLNVSNNIIANVVALSSMLTSITDIASTASSSVANVATSVTGGTSAAGGSAGGDNGNDSKASGDNKGSGSTSKDSEKTEAKDETKPDDQKKDETKPDNEKKEETKPDETKPDNQKKDDTKPDETKSDETKPDNQKKDEEKSNDQKSEDQKKEDSKVEEQKKEEAKSTSQTTSKSASKAKGNQEKPSIMLTGDIVGMQRATDNIQDAKVTSSYIMIAGDKKTSFGLSVDFTVKANVGNISAFKSWMTTKTARKHIDLVSNSVSLLPGSISNTAVYIRIDNVKKVTALYGIGGMYGSINKAPLTTIVLIGGGMFKGQITNNIDAVFILAVVYVPYMKYYTESIFVTKPLMLPFFNINYKLTKTFRFGLTGGTTYSVTESVVNYQLLFGAKLTL